MSTSWTDDLKPKVDYVDVITKYLHNDILINYSKFDGILLRYIKKEVFGIHEYDFKRISLDTKNVISRDNVEYDTLYDNKEYLLKKSLETLDRSFDIPKFYQLKYCMYKTNDVIYRTLKNPMVVNIKFHYNYSNSDGVFVDFANQTLGGDWRTTGIGQEERMVFEIPEFAMFLLENQPVIRDTDIPSETVKYTPIIISGVQRTIEINDIVYGIDNKNRKTIWLNSEIDDLVKKTNDFINILCISAPNLYF